MRLAPLSVLPRGALALAKEAARHILRRPVVGIAVVPTLADGRIVLVRRADTGTWALPGGTVEWGETLLTALARELQEEAGITHAGPPRLLGVFSGVDRDPRFHAVTVAVACEVRAPSSGPVNPLEIREVGLFSASERPRPLAFGMDDYVKLAELRGDAPVVE